MGNDMFSGGREGGSQVSLVIQRHSSGDRMCGNHNQSRCVHTFTFTSCFTCVIHTHKQSRLRVCTRCSMVEVNNLIVNGDDMSCHSVNHDDGGIDTGRSVCGMYVLRWLVVGVGHTCLSLHRHG